MAAKIVSTTVEPMSTKIVARYAKMKRINNDRDIDPSRIRNHIKAMRAGEFLNNLEWAEVLCHEDGKTYRANGQHTSNLLLWMETYRKHPDRLPEDIQKTCGWRSTADLPEPLDNDIVLTKWECDSTSELAVIFSQYDNSVSSRHQRDRMQVHAGNYPELIGVSGQVLTKLLAGVSRFAKSKMRTPGDAVLGIEGFQDPAQEQRHKLLRYDMVREFVVWFLELDSDLRILVDKVPTAAWVVSKYQHSPQEAEESFARIIEEDDRQEGPGYQLMSLVRKQNDRKVKKKSPDQLLRSLERFYQSVRGEVELVA